MPAIDLDIFDLGLCFGKAVNKRKSGRENRIGKLSNSPLVYDPVIIDSINILLADSQISKNPVLKSIMKNAEIYIRDLFFYVLEKPGDLKILDEIRKLKVSIELLRNQTRFPKLHSLVSGSPENT